MRSGEPNMNDNARSLRRRRLLGGLGTAVGISTAGCSSLGDEQSEPRQQASVTIVVANADDVPREYDVTVDWNGRIGSQFSGVVPPAAMGAEMIATTGRAPGTATFTVAGANSSQSGTWNPTDCPEYRAEVVIENGEPSVETSCRSEPSS